MFRPLMYLQSLFAGSSCNFSLALHLFTLLIDCGVLAQRWPTLASAVLACIAMLRCPAMLRVLLEPALELLQVCAVSLCRLAWLNGNFELIGCWTV